ncbi:hypothetical protein HJFPF1_05337 [Paramyrothecium foliicola]|nr:hypothetical protein HJFPF1_05337 [Paramyrothecium foliicola]
MACLPRPSISFSISSARTARKFASKPARRRGRRFLQPSPRRAARHTQNMESDPSLARRASQDTAVSLLQLDPSPIESPSPADAGKELDTQPGTSTPADGSHASTFTSTGGPGLSGSGHGAIFYLTRIQKYSSYAFSVFASLHLANVSLIPAFTRSVPGSETYLLMTREIYQTSVTEPLLISLPVLAHVGSGIALRLLRRQQNLRRYGGATPSVFARRSAHGDDEGRTLARNSWSPWPPLSYISASGYAFSVFYASHFVVNRVLPRLVDGDSSNIGLAYVAHGFAKHPLVSWPAYIGLLAIGSSHMVWGAAKWLGIAPSTRGWQGGDNVVLDKKTRKQRRRKWLSVHGVAAVVTALWAVGGLGVVARGGAADGWVGKLYDDLFARIGL